MYQKSTVGNKKLLSQIKGCISFEVLTITFVTSYFFKWDLFSIKLGDILE